MKFMFWAKNRDNENQRENEICCVQKQKKIIL